MKIDRRWFLRQAAGVSGAALLRDVTDWAGVAEWGSTPKWDGPSQRAGLAQATTISSSELPSPASSGINHIVVTMLENRSFDHLLGWLPNADGKQSNSYPLPNGGSANTHALAPDYQGCGHTDPDHSYAGGRTQYDEGKMDGWLLDTNNDEYSVGFYGPADMPFLAALAQNYTTLDKYFCSILAPTVPNRLFSLAAQTDRLDNRSGLSRLPTIFDTLLAAGVRVRYYHLGSPFLVVWGLKYLPILRLYYDFLLHARLGTLPAVSFVEPRFTVSDNDDSGSDAHPHSNVRRADAFLSTLFRAVARGPAWPSTVFIVTFDEWGGFFDHVAPPRAPAPNNVDPDLDASGNALLGFRVPTIVASPWTRGNPIKPSVSSTTFDHTSILKLIEWRWGLPPLTSRDGSADTVIGNLASVLNFMPKNTQLPALPRPLPPPRSPCGVASL
jgi:phospholipase C